jgi:TonB family protein
LRRRVLAAAVAVALCGSATADAQEGLGVPPPTRDEPPAQLDAAKLSKVPKQAKFVEATYPPEAREKGIEADVVLLLDIDEKGKVQAVGIAEPSPHPGMGFEDAATLAAQDFEFEPAEVDGKPIAVQITYKYKFRLLKAPVAEPPAGSGGAPMPGAAPTAPGAPPPPPARVPVVNFSGTLRERGTRLPLTGVLVTIFREEEGKTVGFEATTDAEGRFRFFDLAAGDWRVLAEPPGYYPFKTSEEVRKGEATSVTYYVEKGSYNPFDVTVTATRPRKEVNRTVLSAAEIDVIPGAAGDPLAVVQNLPGVARSPSFSGQIIVRGSAPEDTQIFVDGVTVPLIYHFGGLRSVIPVGMLNSIEFYPGNFSSQYGRATGGVIDVQLKRLAPKKPSGYADVNLFESGLYLETPLGSKGAVAIAARRSYIDFILNAAVPDDAGVNVIAAPRYYDYQLLANFRPAPAHELRLFVFGSDDRLELLFQNPADLDTAVTSNRFNASTRFYRSLITYRYVPSERVENSLRIAQGRDWLDFSIGNLIFDLDTHTTQVRDTLRYKASDRLTLTLGADVLYLRTSGLVQLPLPPKEGEPVGNFDLNDTRRSDIDQADYFAPAAYAEAEWKPWDRLLLVPGVRVDRFPRTKQFVPQPRFVARLDVAETVTVKGGAGLFTQEPTFDETDPSFGNPDLAAEKALHYSAGVEWKPRPHLTLDATLFYKDLWDLVSGTGRLVPDGRGGQRPLIYDNGGRGRVYGAELIARHEFTNNFAGWLTYTVSRSERRDSGGDEWRLFDYDQTHILALIGTYVLPRNWQIGSRFRLVSGNPRTPVVGAVFNASSDRYDPTYGRVNSARNGAFHQLDLRVDKRWIYQSWVLGAYIDIQNVYNRANPEGLSYNFNYRQSQRQQGLPILPIFGIRGEF